MLAADRTLICGFRRAHNQDPGTRHSRLATGADVVLHLWRERRRKMHAWHKGKRNIQNTDGCENVLPQCNVSNDVCSSSYGGTAATGSR